MRVLFMFSLWLISRSVWADACIIHSQGQTLDVRICQHNRTIPPKLFRAGFCQPHLRGQKVKVAFAEQCPAGFFGSCRNATINGTLYQQDIYYYGVATDARFLKPACERQSHGNWFD